VQCLRDGWLAPGPRTEEFEGKVSTIFGKKYGVMVNSGSSGNLIGLAQLKKLDKFRAIRKRNINRYVENLRKAGTSFVLPQQHDEFDWLAFPLLYHDRKGVLRYLEGNDVQIRVFFAGNITRHPAYRHYLQAFPGADRVMKEGFLIGAHHGLELEDIDRVCELLIEYDKKNGAVGTGTAAAGTPAKERDSVSLDL